MAMGTLDDLIVSLGRTEDGRSLRMLAAIDLGRGFRHLALAEIVLEQARATSPATAVGEGQEGGADGLG